jgi:hypothetical protein
MLAHGIGISFWRVNKLYSFATSVALVNIIHSRAGPTYKTQVFSGIYILPVELKLRPHHKSGIVAQNFKRFARFYHRPVIALVAHGFGPFYKNRVNIVNDEYIIFQLLMTFISGEFTK